jgi:hypothetical protein
MTILMQLPALKKIGRGCRIVMLSSLALTTLATLPVRGSGEGLPVAAPERPASVDLAAFMPRVEDYTHMWWAEGFPGHTPEAPWRRVVQTGSYALALDTDTLRIPHLGPVSGGVCYLTAARADNRAWQNLPTAELALSILVEGKSYRGTAGGPWTQFTGPRLVESGRFLQRADATDLVFTADDGTRLNVEARFETVAWPDRLALVLAARPGLLPIPAGEPCFGRVGGGFGLDGSNHLEIPHSPELDPEQFTLELWVFVPHDFGSATRALPWLVCKNRHEQAEGNYGLVILNGRPQARLNIGGGRENAFSVTAPPQLPLEIEAWNHLAISYDGDVLRLYVNGVSAGEQQIGRRRVPGGDALAFGRRQDNFGDGYHFRGVIDQIRLYDRALRPEEIGQRFRQPETPLPDRKPVREWTFQPDGSASAVRPSQQWEDAELAIRLAAPAGALDARWTLADGQTWSRPEWQEAWLVLDPAAFRRADATCPVSVAAAELPGGESRPVAFDPVRGWHRVDLDGILPQVPPGEQRERHNDAIERVMIRLTNPTEREQPARLLFRKTGGGIRQRIGAPITGISAVLRDPEGHPTGIPVQLSKNWHHRPEGGIYAGTWFHGFSLVRLPPRAEIELELAIVYGHWGGVPAASHAQLCLIGWGSNQLWDQSALGAWGESICYEPDQAQARALVLDVRPLMVRSMHVGQTWHWTHNVGGGDCFRLFDSQGRRVPPVRMRTAYQRHGPCLTEVTYAGRIGDGIQHSTTMSLARTDDLVRGVYRLRMDVHQRTDFSRFVIFQIGADTYSYTGERRMALGSEAGLLQQWDTQWGGEAYRTGPVECSGRVPWVSLHDAVPRRAADDRGSWANRGIVIRHWNARLGGKQAAPWIAERGVRARGADTSTLDLVPPPGLNRLEPGDFLDATIEHLVIPQFADDYYGPNQELHAALNQHQNTWRMVHREAVGNDRQVEVSTGTLESLYPAVAIRTADGAAEFTLTGGLGFVPVTFSGLPSPRGHTLQLDGQPLDQSVHGNDFWQTDYDPVAQRWSRTYNLPISGDQPRTIQLQATP